MPNNQKKPGILNAKTFTVLIIVTGAVMIGGFIAILSFIGNGSANRSARQNPDGGAAQPLGDCSSSDPCTGFTSSTPNGCTNDGPCTQNSSGQRIIPGKVTAVSATSITIKPAAGGNEQTFDVTAATRVNKGGNSANTAFNASDITVGSQVAIVQSGSTNQAELVMLNFQSQTEKAL